jgi:hypothetical protein
MKSKLLILTAVATATVALVSCKPRPDDVQPEADATRIQKQPTLESQPAQSVPPADTNITVTATNGFTTPVPGATVTNEGGPIDVTVPTTNHPDQVDSTPTENSPQSGE